jgi:hypothetical protein
MTLRSEAEEHLQIIRSLMERATIYRAISAPSALAGGLLSVVAAAIFQMPFSLRSEEFSGSERVFLIVWALVLALTAGINTWILWREAKRRGDQFISPGMKLALKALLPSGCAAAFVTLWFVTSGISVCLPIFWMLFYGTGLLATSHFAPRSIAILGWAFALASFTIGTFFFCGSWVFERQFSYSLPSASLLMGATFGLFHLIYAGCIWQKKQP